MVRDDHVYNQGGQVLFICMDFISLIRAYTSQVFQRDVPDMEVAPHASLVCATLGVNIIDNCKNFEI